MCWRIRLLLICDVHCCLFAQSLLCLCSPPCYLICWNFTGCDFERWREKCVYLFDMKQLFYYKTAWMGFCNHTHTVQDLKGKQVAFLPLLILGKGWYLHLCIYLTWKGVISYNGHRRTWTFNLPIHKHTPMKTMCLWRGMLYRWARAHVDYNTNDCKQSASSGWFFAGYVCARKLTILVFRFLTSSLTVPATLIIDSRFALKILFQLYLLSL